MATAYTPITPLAQVRALYRRLDERAQLSIMLDLIQGADGNLDRSDAFIDALQPVDAAFDDAWADLENAADDSMFDGACRIGEELPGAALFGGFRP
jgi:hypothetical protein